MGEDGGGGIDAIAESPEPTYHAGQDAQTASEEEIIRPNATAGYPFSSRQDRALELDAKIQHHFHHFCSSKRCSLDVFECDEHTEENLALSAINEIFDNEVKVNETIGSIHSDETSLRR